MGIDIHVLIYSPKGKLLNKIRCYGHRDYSWFDNITNSGSNTLYDNFPAKPGIPDFDNLTLDTLFNGNDYCDFHYVQYGELKKWFKDFRPDVDAGWVRKYDAWLYREKGIIPENIVHYMNDTMNREDYEFIFIENPYESTKWLLDNLAKEKTRNNSIIVYFFDC